MIMEVLCLQGLLISNHLAVAVQDSIFRLRLASRFWDIMMDAQVEGILAHLLQSLSYI